MTTIALAQPRRITWHLPPFPRLRFAARLRLRNYPGSRRERALAFSRWLGDYLRHQR